MKFRIFFSAAVVASMVFGGLTSCDTDTEANTVQGLKTYDEQYYKNLRAYKKSDHEICYVYYQNWAPLEVWKVARTPPLGASVSSDCPTRSISATSG